MSIHDRSIIAMLSDSKAGKQPGAKGQWRSTPLKAERIIPHYPEQCAACNGQDLVSDLKPNQGYYQFELLPGEGGFKIECQLHHYYGATCSCGHHTVEQPGKGDISEVSNRKTQLELKEQVLVGAMLGSFDDRVLNLNDDRVLNPIVLQPTKCDRPWL